LRPEDAEDFRSQFLFRLVENDFALLTRFEGRSSLRTYLLAAITHFYQDWRNARWGTWRPSAQARRLGATAVALETLTVRDGLTMDEAEEVLNMRQGIRTPRAALEHMFATFPVRAPRRFVPFDNLAQHAANRHEADELVVQSDAARLSHRAMVVLRRVREGLDDDDRALLKLHFDENLSIADISRLLGIEQKPLYRRRDALLRNLRGLLEAEGFGSELASGVFSGPGSLLLPSEREVPGNAAAEVRPSSGKDDAPARIGRVE
jgi:RNA polymerase sigma factor (sigma-70 family)